MHPTPGANRRSRGLPAPTVVRAPERTRPRLVPALFAPVHRRNRGGSAGRRSFAPITVTAPAHADVETGVVSIFAPFPGARLRRRSAAGALRVRTNGLSPCSHLLFLRYKQ